MAIVRLAKITLLGSIQDKAEVFADLQRLGCVHLVHLATNSENKPIPSDLASEAHDALKYLSTSPIQRPAATHRTGFDFATVVREVIELQSRDLALQDEQDDLRKAIDLVRPWGDFRVPSAEEIGGLSLWFYVVPASSDEALARVRIPYEIVQQTGRQILAAVVAEKEPTSFPGTRVDLDPRSLTQLERRLDEVNNELEQVNLARAGMTRWAELLRQSLAEADDEASLMHAMTTALDDEWIFAVQGWAPVRKVDQIRSLAQSRGLALTVEEPAANELPPTLLENPEFLAGGEQAVLFYLTPGYHWWDPTLVVLFSFALFFAMIIGDAGYSILLGIVLGVFWKPLSKSVDGRRFRNLTMILVAFSIVWGVIIGSYFGLAPPKGSFLARIAFIDATNLGHMMQLSIMVGASHLLLANAITAYRMRGTVKGLYPIGWIVAILGGLSLGLASYDQLPPVFRTIGAVLLSIGLPVALLMNSDQPFPPRSIWHVFGRLFDGVKNLMAVSAAFGDTLSYLRLFALGLSGAQLASTFNTLAVDSVKAFGGLGLILAIIIIVLGHSLNFVLCIMGGVIHGLRLNCIEFFNWCATDEGYPFRAFNKKAG